MTPRNYASNSLKPSVQVTFGGHGGNWILTGQDIDIAHRVQSGSDFGLKPIICKFVRRLAKENVMNHWREVESVSPSTLGFSSETSLAQAKIYDHLTPRLGHLLSEANKFKTAHQFQ